MSELVLKINGVDMLQYIPSNGITWGRNDIDSADAGEMANGTLRRDRIITRINLDITIMGNLDTATISNIMKAIYPEWVDVEYLDPLEGAVVTRKFYSNNVPSTVMFVNNGKVLWDGFSFTLYGQGAAK